MIWRCRERTFDVTERTLVMGVLNVTPDSFSDGGRFAEPAAAVEHARTLMARGADLVDVGGESTRPGSQPVAAAEQWRRIATVIETLAAAGVPVSVDTASAEVATRALHAGACVVNDVTALGDPEMATLVARTRAGVVLMHMRGTPATMQHGPAYQDVAIDVRDQLADRMARARAAGIAAEAIALDPGIGFGKTARHSHELLARVDELAALGRPVVIGVSRKSFLGAPLDLPVTERLEAGMAATAVAVFLGARIVRAHDVRETVRAVRIAELLRSARRAVPHASPAAGAGD
ncbi:MAG TPA: dihydropteroate synthase [Candidatus Eisenbacteria bacterium]|nr:dihydropteroate synthase [Candidatus Eisenbacteria bacterium]